MNQIRLEAKQKMDEERQMKNKAIAESADLKNEMERLRRDNAQQRKNISNLSEKIKHLEITLSKSVGVGATSQSGKDIIFKSKEMALNKKTLNLQYKIRHLKFKEQL